MFFTSLSVSFMKVRASDPFSASFLISFSQYCLFSLICLMITLSYFSLDKVRRNIPFEKLCVGLEHWHCQKFEESVLTLHNSSDCIPLLNYYFYHKVESVEDHFQFLYHPGARILQIPFCSRFCEAGDIWQSVQYLAIKF